MKKDKHYILLTTPLSGVLTLEFCPKMGIYLKKCTKNRNFNFLCQKKLVCNGSSNKIIQKTWALPYKSKCDYIVRKCGFLLGVANFIFTVRGSRARAPVFLYGCEIEFCNSAYYRTNCKKTQKCVGL